MANSWRNERWDSLRLLTPNWQSRLPGARYEGADPDGYMTATEVVELVTRYAVRVGAPVRGDTDVNSVRRIDGGYHLMTSHGELRSEHSADRDRRLQRARRCRPSQLRCRRRSSS